MSLRNIIKVAHYYETKYNFNRLAQDNSPETLVAQLNPIMDKVVASMGQLQAGWKFGNDFDLIKNVYYPLYKFIAGNKQDPKAQNLNLIYSNLANAHQLYWKKFNTQQERQATLENIKNLVNQAASSLKMVTEGNVGVSYNTQGDLNKALKGESKPSLTTDMKSYADQTLPALSQLFNNIDNYKNAQNKEDMVKNLQTLKSSLVSIANSLHQYSEKFPGSYFAHAAKYLQTCLGVINTGLQANSENISTMWTSQIVNPLKNAVTILTKISGSQ